MVWWIKRWLGRLLRRLEGSTTTLGYLVIGVDRSLSVRDKKKDDLFDSGVNFDCGGAP